MRVVSLPGFGGVPCGVVAARVEEILERVRAGGGRLTPARRGVVAALVAANGHVNADELTATVQADHPDVHQSTVYRILEDLEDRGLVVHVHLGHGPAVYHLAGDAHGHLVCQSCGAVIEVPDKLLAPFSRRLSDQFGFEVCFSHFAVGGWCAACRPQQGAAASTPA